MRIPPIESPRNPVLRVLYWLARRQFGRTITPWKVIFARLPRTIPTQLGIYMGLGKGLPLPDELQLLLSQRVAGMNGCAFCVDIGRAVATYRGGLPAKLEVLDDWRSSPLFDARERAALAYVEEATRHRAVGDDTFAELRRHYDDAQIVAITWLNAVENYFNLLNRPLEIESDGLCAIAEQRTRATRRPRAPAAAMAPSE